LTLGGEDATISSMGLVEVSGSAASVLRRLIYAVRMPTSQQALTAAISSTNKRFESILLSKGKDVPKKKIINWQ
jgi:NADH dehydrogenase FAD-containing subunit